MRQVFLEVLFIFSIISFAAPQQCDAACGCNYFEYNGNCESCNYGCASCSSSEFCTSCDSGFYLSGSQCLTIICPYECSSCSSSEVCTSCNTGYYPLGNQCLSCATNCNSCSSADICESCDQGFFLNGASCQACSNGCNECDEFATCLVCDQGYYMGSNGDTCSACENGCTTCTDSSSCVVCDDDHVLQGSKCTYFGGAIETVFIVVALVIGCLAFGCMNKACGNPDTEETWITYYTDGSTRTSTECSICGLFLFGVFIGASAGVYFALRGIYLAIF